MVTGSVPVPVDPHGPITAAAHTPTAAVPGSGTFQSIYQNLPAGDGSTNLSPLLSTSKDAGAKRNPKAIDDQLPLTALFAQTVDSPLRQPWAPLSLSLSTAAPALTAKELAQAADASSVAQGEGANSISNIVQQQAALPDAASKTARSIALAKSAAQHPPARVALPDLSVIDGRHAGLIPVAAPLPNPTLPEGAGADGKQPQAETWRGAIGSAMAQHAADAVNTINKGIAASLGPRSESLAFSLRLVETEAAGKRVQAAAQPESPRGQSHNDSKNEEQASAATIDAASTIRGESPSHAAGDIAAHATSMSWNEAAVLSRVESRPEIEIAPQTHEAAHTNAPASIHEVQPVAPEAPRANATSEILLQLGSKEQPASIRVSDRGGAVNVTVHAADPDLRSSLRSNLGDLASQLSHQGWKAEVVKSGTILTRTETPQDPRSDGQRSSGQQSFTQGERQQGRDRRGNSNEWLNEFEEQTSGNAGGGK